MEKPILSFNQLAPLIIQKYERYLSTAFDESMTLLQKVNKVIVYLNQIGELTNSVVDQWNEVMEWIMNEGLTDYIIQKLDQMVLDGTMDQIINETIFNDLNTRLDSVEESIEDHTNKIKDLVGIDVRDFATVQEAVDATPENGTLIMEDNATYTLNSTLNITKNIEFVGNNLTFVINHEGVGIDARGQLVGTTTLSNYSRDDYDINLASSVNVKQGYLLNIISDELYDTSRAYYYKGGTVVATNLFSGGQVEISRSLPFDINNATVYIYKPITVKLDTINIKYHSDTAVSRSMGIRIIYSKNSRLENVYVDGFNHCFHLRKHVNTYGRHLLSGRSYFDGSGESYGLSSYEGTGLKLESSIFHSGRHGIAVSGNECTFDTIIENCSVSNEVKTTHAFDSHGSCYNMRVVSSTLYNIGVTGNITFEDCTILDNGYGHHNLGVSDQYDYSSYSFENCYFGQGSDIRTVGYKQLATLTRNKISFIRFKSCKGLNIRLVCDISPTYGEDITGQINKIIVEHTDQVNIVINDAINDIYLTGGKISSQLVAKLLEQKSNKNGVTNVTIRDYGIPLNYQTVSLVNFGTCVIENCKFIEVGGSDSSLRFSYTNGKVIIRDTDLTPLVRGLETTGIASLVADNSVMKFYSTNKANIVDAKQASYVAL